MKTLQAISILANEIEQSYASIGDFSPSDIRSKIELLDGNHTAFIVFKDCGEGEISDIEFWYLKQKSTSRWTRGGKIGFDEEIIAQVLSDLMKLQYSILLAEYNEEHAEELAESESEYYADMYYDNKMCLALGK